MPTEEIANATTTSPIVTAFIRFGVSQVRCRVWSQARTPLAPAVAAMTRILWLPRMLPTTVCQAALLLSGEAVRCAGSSSEVSERERAGEAGVDLGHEPVGHGPDALFESAAVDGRDLRDVEDRVRFEVGDVGW